jgi:RNA polymerase sigma-70 factor (ECF subfamily)
VLLLWRDAVLALFHEADYQDFQPFQAPLQVSSEQLAELLGLVALGDRRAFGELYDRTSAKLFGVCLRLLKDRAEAEDVLQEVFVKIWHGARTYSAQGYSPISWLVAVARNHAIDRLRARKPEGCTIDEAEDLADDRPDPERMVLQKAGRSQLDSCLDELQQRRADAVRGAYIEGMSYQELSHRLGVPLNTIRTWLRRSLISLRECLER